MAPQPGFWTATHDLVILNAILALATLGIAVAALKTIKASNTLAEAAKEQTAATKSTVEVATEQLILGRQQLDQERAALEASIRPVIIDIPVDRHLIQVVNYLGDEQIMMPVRNVGSGAAIVRSTFVTRGPGNVIEAKCSHQVIPVGEEARLLWNHPYDFFAQLEASSRNGQAGDDLLFGVWYSDIGRNQRTQSLFHLSRDLELGDQSFRVTRVELYSCDDQWTRSETPFVSSGDE